MGKYTNELTRAMERLGEHPKVRIIGQSTLWDGHALFRTWKNVPVEKRWELPVFEDFQMGMTIGLAMQDWIPLSIYPRMDFIILAANQLTNHLANIRLVSNGKWKRHIIIRVTVGATEPLYSGLQHSQDHTETLRTLSRGEVDVVELHSWEDVFPAYEYALLRTDKKPTILVEYSNLYNGE